MKKQHHGCTLSPWVTVAGTALYSATWQRTWHYSKKQASHGVFVHVHNRCPSMPQPQPRSTSTTRMMRRIPHNRASDPHGRVAQNITKLKKKIELLGGAWGAGGGRRYCSRRLSEREMDLKRVMVIVGFQTGKRKTNRRYAVMDGTCGRERREAAGLGFSRVVSRGVVFVCLRAYPMFQVVA